MSLTGMIYHRTHYGDDCFHQSFRPGMNSHGNVSPGPDGRDLLEGDYGAWLRK
jgi:hypothetical protein